MKRKIELLNIVALIVDIPAAGLTSGEMGTVVEILGPDVYEVEFSSDDGIGYAQLAVNGEDLIVLHNQGSRSAIAA